MNKIKILLLIFITATIFTSCNNKSEKELEELETYISTNSITTEPTSSGLYYIESQEGTGDFPSTGDKVEVHYDGYFLNGDKFDSSRDRGETFSFDLGQSQVIAGWDEGIALMKKGGKAQLIIPSTLGYGSQARGSIPGYSTLIFDVELIDIN